LVIDHLSTNDVEIPSETLGDTWEITGFVLLPRKINILHLILMLF